MASTKVAANDLICTVYEKVTIVMAAPSSIVVVVVSDALSWMQNLALGSKEGNDDGSAVVGTWLLVGLTETLGWMNVDGYPDVDGGMEMEGKEDVDGCQDNEGFCDHDGCREGRIDGNVDHDGRVDSGGSSSSCCGEGIPDG